MSSYNEKLTQLKAQRHELEKRIDATGAKIASLAETQKKERQPLKKRLKDKQKEHRQKVGKLRQRHGREGMDLDSRQQQEMSDLVGRQRPIEDNIKEELKSLETLQRRDMGKLQLPNDEDIARLEQFKDDLDAWVEEGERRRRKKMRCEEALVGTSNPFIDTLIVGTHCKGSKLYKLHGQVDILRHICGMIKRWEPTRFSMIDAPIRERYAGAALVGGK